MNCDLKAKASLEYYDFVLKNVVEEIDSTMKTNRENIQRISIKIHEINSRYNRECENLKSQYDELTKLAKKLDKSLKNYNDSSDKSNSLINIKKNIQVH